MAGAGHHGALVPPWPAPAHDGDEVRTIFVLGFPPDMKERELHNLLRWWPGFEASQVNFKGEQPMGFALFSSSAMALAARDALQNLQFDPDSNSLLRAEMAKKNLYVKRGPASEAPSDQTKRLRTVGDYTPTSFAPPGAFAPVTPSGWGSLSFVPSALAYDPYGGYGIPQFPQSMITTIVPAGYAPVQNIKDNPPCNTLFVGNLSEQTNEAELQGLFCGQPGFRQMKIIKQERSIVCFIEFLDIASAIAVHNYLQGAVLTSSDRGGMRLQYSKNPFGKKKEVLNPTDGGAPGVPDPNGVPGRPAHGD